MLEVDWEASVLVMHDMGNAACQAHYQTSWNNFLSLPKSKTRDFVGLLISLAFLQQSVQIGHTCPPTCMFKVLGCALALFVAKPTVGSTLHIPDNPS